jgi:hypothetical protein
MYVNACAFVSWFENDRRACGLTSTSTIWQTPSSLPRPPVSTIMYITMRFPLIGTNRSKIGVKFAVKMDLFLPIDRKRIVYWGCHVAACCRAALIDVQHRSRAEQRSAEHSSLSVSQISLKCSRCCRVPWTRGAVHRRC